MKTQTPCLKLREAMGRGNDNLRTQRTEDEKCTKTKKHQKHIKDIQGSRISPWFLLLSTITMLCLLRAEYRDASDLFGGPSKSICDPTTESDNFLGAADVFGPQWNTSCIDEDIRLFANLWIMILKSFFACQCKEKTKREICQLIFYLISWG